MSQLRLTYSDCLYTNQTARVCVYSGSYSPQALAVVIKVQVHSSMQSANVAIKEAMNQVALDHRSICKVYECFLEPAEFGEMKSVIVIERMQGDLHQEILKRATEGRFWKEIELFSMLESMVSALSYAQSKGISHRDIKPQNIFLTETAELKLGDFGSSSSNMDLKRLTCSLQGSPFFLSPELKRYYLAMMGNNPVENEPYDPFLSDVYSLGLTFLYMAKLAVPESLMNLADLESATTEEITSLENYGILAPYLWDMLTVDPKERQSFTTLEQRFEQDPHVFQDFGESMNQEEEKCSDGLKELCPICNKCRLPDNRDVSERRSVWESFCICRTKNEPLQCYNCHETITDKIWMSTASPEDIETASNCCSQKCFDALRTLKRQSSPDLLICLQCNQFINTATGNTSLISLSCSHGFHSKDCFFWYIYHRRDSDVFKCKKCSKEIQRETIEDVFRDVCPICLENAKVEKECGHKVCSTCNEEGECLICEKRKRGLLGQCLLQ